MKSLMSFACALIGLFMVKKEFKEELNTMTKDDANMLTNFSFPFPSMYCADLLTNGW